ncbi:hypothetical protein BN77_3211 [Rhizobium mesoamericanum STM3625]|uniref:Tetratricopeptide repeat protein n=2 Tax=Rhizobium mesoamericanum TaxID=1079800 RepID=K0PQB7_9HYPH|nr:hypothetical protein BN77_3211 [Rhizobium mesoamericanum STM3625]
MPVSLSEAAALAGEIRAAEIDPLNSAIVGDVGFILFRAGRQDAIETLNRVIQMAPDLDNAFLWLERAYEDHDFQLAFLQGHEFEQLKADSRYKAMQTKLGFPPRS